MAINFLRISTSMLSFLAHGAVIYNKEKDYLKKIQKIRKNFNKHSKKIIRQFGVKVTLKGRTDLLHSDQAFLVLGNHSSYLDMMILESYYPCLFVSSVEQKNNGILGWISQVAGTIFVDRINKSKLPSDIQQVATCLEQNIPLCLFLEGTTSNGRDLLPFKSSLLKAIEKKPTKILPICIRYRKLNGKVLKGDDFDTICWYGDMGFFPHYYKLTRQDSIEVELIVLEPFLTTAEMTRKEIAKHVFQEISQVFYKQDEGLT